MIQRIDAPQEIGSDFEITCLASGNPQPTIYWTGAAGEPDNMISFVLLYTPLFTPFSDFFRIHNVVRIFWWTFF